MESLDVAALLQRFLTARNLDITVRVLLNDTTGTLVAGAYLNHSVGVNISQLCTLVKMSQYRLSSVSLYKSD